jgi:hypothetical protein
MTKAEQAKWEERRRQAAIDAKIVAGTEEGERLFGYILDFCHVFRDSMPPDGNMNITLFNEGQRSVGNEIVALTVNPEHRFKTQVMRQVASQAEGADI